MSDSVSLSHLTAIFQAGLDRANPMGMVSSHLRLDGESLAIPQQDLRFDLRKFDRIVLLGAGKASARMALAVEGMLGDRISGGVIAVKSGHTERLARCEVLEAGHPVPDASSVRAAGAVAHAAQSADERTLVIGLYSGGGSAILCSPDGLDLAEKQAVTRALLASGATIHELNCVRKHLSGIKGGRLARLLYPATSVNLILSDVVGDDLGVIASGPTSPDQSTYADALEVLRHRAVADKVPRAAIAALEAGAAGRIPESPKAGDPALQRCHNVLIGSNRASALAAADKARELGYRTMVLTSRLEGEAREMARLFLALGRDCRASGLPIEAPACIIAGGETTVLVRGTGKGGRNQELALAYLSGLESAAQDAGACLLSASTDGSDGPTDAAGAFASYEILREARLRGLDPRAYLENNDSYTFFDRVGRLLRTGPTNTNVCDLQILIVLPRGAQAEPAPVTSSG